MRVLARPGLLLRRRLSALEKQMPAALAGDVEGIHQARVASRRLREMLPLLAPVAGEHAAHALRSEIRTITRHLGPLREIDVALMMLADLEAAAPEHAAAIAVVSTRTGLERERVWRHVGRALGSVHMGPLGRHVRGLAAAIDPPAERSRCAVRSATRLDLRLARLDEVVRAAGVVYAAGALHQVRIALKKFRYALELAADLGRFRVHGSLKRLKSLQDLLGELHDLQVLVTRVRDREAANRAASTRRQLRALADELDERIRQRHSRYLDQRETLVPVVGRARLVAGTLGLMGADSPRE